MVAFIFKRFWLILVHSGKKVAGVAERSTLGVALARFSQHETAAYAAGLAFYAIFSLFPLVLVLVSVGSFFLERYLTAGDLFEIIVKSFPLYQDWIRSNLMNVIDRRGAIGLVGLITLTWSASAYFNILVRAMNNAWPGVKPRNFVKRRLLAIGMIAGIVLLLMLSFVSSAALELLSHFQVPMGGSIQFYETFVWKFFNNYFPYISALMIFWLLYYLAPNVKVKKRAAFIGALPASIIWNLLNSGFTWYLSSGLVRYEIVYGSLSTIVSLLFWIYLTNMIVLLGAYLSASAQYNYFPDTIPNHSRTANRPPAA